MSQKVSYASNAVDPVINLFIPHEVRIHLHICDNSIVEFGIKGLCLVFLNTSRVDSLDSFRKSVVDKLITELCIIFKEYHSKDNNMIIQYSN